MSFGGVEKQDLISGDNHSHLEARFQLGKTRVFGTDLGEMKHDKTSQAKLPNCIHPISFAARTNTKYALKVFV